MDQIKSKTRTQINREILKRLEEMVTLDMGVCFNNILRSVGFIAEKLKEEDSQSALNRVDVFFKHELFTHELTDAHVSDETIRRILSMRVLEEIPDANDQKEQTTTGKFKAQVRCNRKLLQILKELIEYEINLNFSEILRVFGFVTVRLENEESQVTLDRVEKFFKEVENCCFF